MPTNPPCCQWDCGMAKGWEPGQEWDAVSCDSACACWRSALCLYAPCVWAVTKCVCDCAPIETKPELTDMACGYLAALQCHSPCCALTMCLCCKEHGPLVDGNGIKHRNCLCGEPTAGPEGQKLL
eukprot:TRINITY_DN48097_c0_g1_i1.p3 TRINITY_DN48097_c0_g1~~TRINITY_DN48097_c0_g1_i1.p3  ORF type:complete len:147 (+),score=36.44 TRINITY_DN48097_c0_g1_i1:68-442(+)